MVQPESSSANVGPSLAGSEDLHRASAAPYDAQQPVSFVVIDLANANSLSHARILK
ncbi:hypothetical protein [Nonomuraea solani]|uniref:hypothetical protein n=1 Tax=Nonomuraea solani TaxID=1144553 RepID=UPI00190EC1ED|nr:hypothetical protein [Nonomuraea solani]